MMTTTFVKGALAATAALITVTPALADRVDYRQYKQENRIEQGERSGRLTRGEAARLEAEQDRIAATERRFKRDGRLDGGERAYLNYEQNRASRHIWAEKHDFDDRGPGWHHRFGRNWGWGYGRFYKPRWW